MKKAFKYIENLWVGRDGKPSLKSASAIALVINFMINISHAVWKWEVGRSMSDLAIVLGIEAGLIAAMMGLTTYSNIKHESIRAEAGEPIDEHQSGPRE